MCTSESQSVTLSVYVMLSLGAKNGHFLWGEGATHICDINAKEGGKPIISDGLFLEPRLGCVIAGALP